MISPEKKPSPTKKEERDMEAEELIQSLRAQVAAAKQATTDNDDWRGKELKNCYAKIASLEEELKTVKSSGTQYLFMCYIFEHF